MKKLDKKIFGTLFFSIFVAVTGIGIVVPLLPLYASSLGASGLYIGLLFGAFSLSRTFFLPYFGRMSDIRGRKPYILAGLFTYTLVSFAFIMSNDMVSLISIRFVQGIASAMLMPVIQAYVGDISPGGSEGAVMGLFNMSIFMGLSIGPLLGGVISERFGLHLAFASMGFLSLTGFFLTLFRLPPVRFEHISSRKNKPVTWKLGLSNKDIAGLFIYRFAYAASIGIIWGFLPVFADSEFSLSGSSIGILVMLGVFISGLVQPPMGLLADRFNKKLIIVVGGLIAAAGIYSFEWADGFWSLFISNLLFGLGGGISTPALMALAVLKGNQIMAMGSVMGLMVLAHSLGMLAGSLMGGLMMDIFQLSRAFSFGGFIMMLGVGFLSICLNGEEEPLPKQV